MPWHPTLTDLRIALAALYPTIDDARRVVVDAGLDPLTIGFDAKAILNWQHILEEALRSNRTNALLAVARLDYPENAELARTATAFTSASVADRLPFEPETVAIPAGPFWLGSDTDTATEAPRRKVELAAYRIGKYPITNAQYAEFLRHTPKQAEPPKAGWFLRKPAKGKELHPVVGVSWHDAMAYCSWLSQATSRTYRLPSEAEWEKAARGPDGRRYPWGDEWQDTCANVNGSGTTAVDRFPAGASPYGCFDMLGNVQEWTSTLWDEADPASGYVLRGGSFRSQSAAVRCSARDSIHADSKVIWRGFRIVLVD